MAGDNAAMSAGSANWAQSPGSGGGDLGKIYAATQAISALTSLAGGVTGMMASRGEADLADQQAEIARQEAEIDAAAKAREVARFQSNQAHKYAGSGVTLEGTPAIMLEETRRLGQQEVDALIRRGNAQADLMRMKAGMARRSGRNSFIGSILNTGLNALQGYVAGRQHGIYGQSTSGKSGSSILDTPIPQTDPLGPIVGKHSVPASGYSIPRRF